MQTGPGSSDPGLRVQGLPFLFGGADQHLVDGDVPGARNDVGDRVGDVRGLHRLPELAPDGYTVAGPHKFSQPG